MDTSHYLFLNQSQNRLVNLHRPLDVTVIVVVVVAVAWASALDIATTDAATSQHQLHRHTHPHPCHPQSSRALHKQKELESSKQPCNLDLTEIH